jgi:choline dehydrogenase-like flavoprotein
MPIISSNQAKPEYDLVIVGSGAGGGQTAYILTLAGLKVAMLEAGRNYDPLTETAMFNLPNQAPLRGAVTPDKHMGFYDSTIDGGWQVPGEPYTNASDKTEEQFMWWRPRMLGGRTNHWGRIALRNGPGAREGPRCRSSDKPPEAAESEHPELNVETRRLSFR